MAAAGEIHSEVVCGPCKDGSRQRRFKLSLVRGLRRTAPDCACSSMQTPHSPPRLAKDVRELGAFWGDWLSCGGFWLRMHLHFLNKADFNKQFEALWVEMQEVLKDFGGTYQVTRAVRLMPLPCVFDSPPVATVRNCVRLPTLILSRASFQSRTTRRCGKLVWKCPLAHYSRKRTYQAVGYVTFMYFRNRPQGAGMNRARVYSFVYLPAAARRPYFLHCTFARRPSPTPAQLPNAYNACSERFLPTAQKMSWPKCSVAEWRSGRGRWSWAGKSASLSPKWDQGSQDGQSDPNWSRLFGTVFLVEESWPVASGGKQWMWKMPDTGYESRIKTKGTTELWC